MSKTWGDTAKEFLACKTPKEAKAWFAKEIERHSKEYGYNPERSEHILRESLGYMMGYYDDKTAARMQKLIDLTHPVFPWVGKRLTTEKDLKKAYSVGRSSAKGRAGSVLPFEIRALKQKPDPPQAREGTELG